MKRAYLGLPLALALASCAQGPGPSPVALSDLGQLRLVSVDVHSQGAVQSWPIKEKELLARADVDPQTRSGLPSRDAREFPTAQVYFESALRQQIGADMQKSIAPLMRGTRKVQAVVTIHNLDVPSAVRRLLVDQIAKLEMQIDLVDAASGQTLLTYHTPEAHQWLIGGFGGVIESAVNSYDPGARMVDEAVADYQGWLEHR